MRVIFVLLVLLLAASPARAQCDGLTVIQQGPTLVVDHAASYNCAVFVLEHTASLSADTLAVRELATCDSWMDCYCPYRSHLAFWGIAPGDYVLRFTYAEAEAGGEPPAGWQVCHLAFTVDEPSGDVDSLVLVAENEGCGIIPTTVPEVESATWTSIKGIF